MKWYYQYSIIMSFLKDVVIFGDGGLHPPPTQDPYRYYLCKKKTENVSECKRVNENWGPYNDADIRAVRVHTIWPPILDQVVLSHNLGHGVSLKK